jgi:EmrB/QacA subfamily drug resistance transporter
VTAPAQRTDRSWVGPLFILVSGTFMSALDTSIVNVAIPKMMVSLNAAPDDVQWLVTAYTLTMGCVVPLAGWLSLRIGLSRLHQLCMVGFALTSAACGLAWDLPSMVAFRILQAVPGGMLPLVALILLLRIVPKQHVGSAMGIYGLGVTTAPALGPVLGGWLVEYLDWRLIFYINVPVGILGAIAAAMAFPSVRPTTWPRFDVLGFVTVAYGMFAVLLACAEGEDWGWTGYRILGLIVSGLLSLALFVVIELQVDNPLIDLRVLRNWPFVNSMLLVAVGITNLFSGLYFIPQFLQNVQGLQAFDAGLVLLPASLVTMVLMPVAGRLYDRIGPRWPVFVGLCLAAYASFRLAHITVDTPRHYVTYNMALRNAGLALFMMPNITAGISALPAAMTGAGSTMNNVMRQAASSISVAVFSGINLTTAQQLIPDRAALYASGAEALPQVAQATAQGAPGMLALYQEFTNRITTQTFANSFFLVALFTAGGAVLGLALRSGRPATAPATPPAPASDTAPAGDPGPASDARPTRPSGDRSAESGGSAAGSPARPARETVRPPETVRSR